MCGNVPWVQIPPSPPLSQLLTVRPLHVALIAPFPPGLRHFHGLRFSLRERFTQVMAQLYRFSLARFSPVRFAHSAIYRETRWALNGPPVTRTSSETAGGRSRARLSRR